MTSELEFEFVETNESKQDIFQNWYTNFLTENYQEVFITNKTPLLLRVPFTDEITKAITLIVPSDVNKGPGTNDSMACNFCRKQLRSLMCFRTFDNKPYFMTNNKDEYHVELWPLWDAVRQGTPAEVVVVNPQMFGLQKSGGFNHFSIETSTEIPTLTDLTQRQRLLDKYIPMMTEVFSANGIAGIFDSLDTLIKVLPTVTYGVKLLESAQWFRRHITENFKYCSRPEQLKILSNAIFDLEYSIDAASKDPVLPLYHQLVNNTLNALEKCNNISGLQNLLTQRLSPTNYQVKTASATDGQIAVAEKLIGDFSVKLMTVESAINNHAAIAIKHVEENSASNAYNNMKSKKTPKNNAAGFASRSNSTLTTIKTMKQLLENLPENLEVNVQNQTPVHAVDFDGLKEGIYQTKFSWGFHNGSGPRQFGMTNEWYKVIAILPMKNNYLFICDIPSPILTLCGPCCHVSLLTAAYNKSCGQTFGNLSSNLKINIPSVGPYAIGIGTSLNPESLNDPDPKIIKSLSLRSGKSTFTIN